MQSILIRILTYTYCFIKIDGNLLCSFVLVPQIVGGAFTPVPLLPLTVNVSVLKNILYECKWKIYLLMAI